VAMPEHVASNLKWFVSVVLMPGRDGMTTVVGGSDVGRRPRMPPSGVCVQIYLVAERWKTAASGGGDRWGEQRARTRATCLDHNKLSRSSADEAYSRAGACFGHAAA